MPLWTKALGGGQRCCYFQAFNRPRLRCMCCAVRIHVFGSFPVTLHSLSDHQHWALRLKVRSLIDGKSSQSLRWENSLGRLYFMILGLCLTRKNKNLNKGFMIPTFSLGTLIWSNVNDGGGFVLFFFYIFLFFFKTVWSFRIPSLKLVVVAIVRSWCRNKTAN